MNIVKQFNKFAKDNSAILQKALSSATGVGEALSPQSLEQLITDTIIRLSPELAMLVSKKISAISHDFNRLIARPTRGGAGGESGASLKGNSKTVPDNVRLKVIKRIGQVTNFLIDGSDEYLDTASYEMENNIQSHVLDLIYYLKWGNASHAGSYEFDGLEKMISENYEVEVAGGVVPTSLGFLDTMIDSSNRAGGSKHNRAFMMSPEMLSKISSLLENVRLNQGLNAGGMSQVEVNGGWRLNAYRDIPIIETTSQAPVVQMDLADVTLATSATGGGLSDDEYFIYIAPVTLEGEQLATAVKAITLSGGGSVQTIDISLSEAFKTDGVEADVLAYKIYIGLTTGNDNATFVKEVSAFIYNSVGEITGDNGVDADIVITALSGDASVATHLVNNPPLVATGGVSPESVVLWDMDPIQGLGKMAFTNKGGAKFEGLVTTKQLAETDDFIQFLIKSYCALVPSHSKTSFWHRGLRVS